MTEEERDYKLGLRAVVLEEFVMSFLNLPHLIALPAKGLSFALYYLPYSWYVDNNSLFFRRQFKSGLRNLFMSQFETFQNLANDLRAVYKPEYQWNFYHVQLNLVFQLIFIAMFVLEALTWFTVHADLVMMKVLSGGEYYALHSPIPPRPLPRPPCLRVLQLLQVVWMLAHIVIRTALGVAPFILCLLYSSYSVIGCVVGPLFLNVFWYVLIYANLSTLYNILDYFPYYAPLTNIQNVGTIAGRRMLLLSSAFFSQVNAALTKLYSLIVNGVTNVLANVAAVMLTQSLRASSGTLLKSYASILFKAGRILKPFGLLGDLFFTPLTIVWMLWPLAVAYFLQELYYFVPAGLVSLTLVVKGYKTAQQAWAGRQ